MHTFTVADCFTDIKNGANIKQEKSTGGIPITRIETISNNRFNRDRMGYAGITDASKYKDYLLEDGDLLMSHINSPKYLGRTVMYRKEDHEKIIHGMNLLRLRAVRDLIMPEYAELLFQTPQVREQIRRITKKSVNQASFSIADLKRISINLPSLAQQSAVIERFIRLTIIKNKRQQELLKLDDLVKARFVEMFGDPETNPMHWVKKPLSTVIIAANNGMARRGNDSDGNIVLRLVELQDGYIDLSSPNKIKLTDKEKCRYLLKEKDFLFVRVNGNPENVGRCAVFHDIGEPVYHNDHIIRVHFDDEVLEGTFASTLLNSPYGKVQLKNQIKTSAGQYTVSQEGIGAIKAILPPLDLQQQFASFVTQVDQAKASVRAALDKAQVLFDSLMQVYFG
jgi:type I restriction enzyme S subunit